MLDRRARGAVAQPLVDARRMQREVLADADVVDGDAGVLADEVLLAVGDVDVPVDRLEHAACRAPTSRGSRAAASASRRSCGMSFSAHT